MSMPSPTLAEPQSIQEAIAANQHGRSLQLLHQLPLRNRWDAYFLLQRTFNKGAAKDYVRSLSHDLLYRAYREELAGNLKEASRLYRMLLQHNAGIKLSMKAREGFKRIANGKAHQTDPTTPATPQTTKAVVSVAPTIIPNHATSLILLDPVASNDKKDLAVALSKIIQTDPYTARLKIPSIEFRILRHGIGMEMSPLFDSLSKAGVSSQHVGLKAVQSIPVYDVLHIESTAPNLVLQVREPDRPQESMQLTLDWSDITQRVDGLLPLFEDVVERTNKGKMIRKMETQDHAQICDLHLKDNRGILRFYDAGYQFNQGIPLAKADSPHQSLEVKTSWAQWQGLKSVLEKNLPAIPEHHKFDHFAGHAVEQIEILAKIDAHIHIIRRHESYWDQAFHLYSCLHYLRG